MSVLSRRQKHLQQDSSRLTRRLTGRLLRPSSKSFTQTFPLYRSYTISPFTIGTSIIFYTPYTSFHKCWPFPRTGSNSAAFLTSKLQLDSQDCNSGDTYTLHLIDGAHRAQAFASAVLATVEYNADRSPRPRPTGTVQSTFMASLTASNEGSLPGAWKVRCELYFFGDGVKSSENKYVQLRWASGLSSTTLTVVVVVVVVSHIQRIGCQPDKTTLHGGQSRSWSAEQGKKEKKSLAAPPSPPPPPRALLVRRKKKKKTRGASKCLGATQVGVTQAVSVRLASVQGFLRLVG